MLSTSWCRSTFMVYCLINRLSYGCLKFKASRQVGVVSQKIRLCLQGKFYFISFTRLRVIPKFFILSITTETLPYYYDFCCYHTYLGLPILLKQIVPQSDRFQINLFVQPPSAINFDPLIFYALNIQGFASRTNVGKG